MILVETAGSANLGAVARSATAFGVTAIRLVSPLCQPDDQSRQWACYGAPALDRLERFESLEEAVADLDLAVAFTRREGKRRHRHHSLPELVEKVLPEYRTLRRLGLVFGNETRGLGNHHLDLCGRSTEIPVIAPNGSLNLAHAVSVGLYELVGRARPLEPSDSLPAPPPGHPEAPATAVDRARLLERAEETLRLTDYPRHQASLEEEMVKLSDLLFRSNVQEWEVRLLQGMLKQVRYRLTHPSR